MLAFKMAPRHSVSASPERASRLGVFLVLSRWAVGRVARLIARLASIAVLSVLCAAAFMPLAPSFPRPFLDDGWRFGLNAALARHLIFGRDIIFTFGPYGVVYTDLYDPATDGLAMAAGLLLALSANAGLALLAAGWRVWIALALAASFNAFILRDPIFLALPACFVALASVARAPRTALAVTFAGLAASLGLLVLVKGTFAAASASAICAGALALVLRGRYLLGLAVCLIAPATTLLAWLLAGQPLGALPSFLHAQSRIVAGYTEAMSLQGPAWQVWAYLAAAGTLLLLNLRSLHAQGSAGLVLGAYSSLLLFLAFKAGFVRHDGHAAAAAGSLVVLGAVMAMTGSGWRPLAGLGVAMLAAIPIYRQALHIGPRTFMLAASSNVQAAGAGLLERVDGGHALRRDYEAALAAIRDRYPLPKLRGTTDIYSYGQSILLANGLDWAPRPVLQSYSAYEPDLEADDARHLTGPSAPENVIFSVASIDDRLPSLDDGPSWLPLLFDYAPEMMWGDAAILHRVPTTETGGALLGPTAARTARLNEEIALPPGEKPLWAEVDVAPTLAGRALSALFKPPPLMIRMSFAGGVVRTFRFISGMGRAGFLMSPLVGTAAQLIALEIPDAAVWNDMVPHSFEILGDARFWRRDFSFTLAPVLVPQRPSIRDVLFSTPTVAPAVASADASRCWLDGVDGRLVDHRQPVSLGGLVRLTGWAFGEGATASEPDPMVITLRLAGRELTFRAERTDRPDVGRYFGHPGLSHVGFQALLDLGGLTGDGTLGVNLSNGSGRSSCVLSAVHVVSGGA